MFLRRTLMIQAEQWMDCKQAALGLSVFLGCSILGAMIRFGRHGVALVVVSKKKISGGSGGKTLQAQVESA